MVQPVPPPMARKPETETIPAGKKRNRLALTLLWALAAGFILLTASSYRRVALAADQLEAFARALPENTVGRGELARYAVMQPTTMFDPDSHCWIDLTQRQIAEGTVRPHDFPYDNAPVGRERHWSSSFSWWLLILGGVSHPLLGTTLAQSAAWANPVLFVLFIGALAWALRRRLDDWTSGCFLVTLTALFGVEWDFSYGRPDHHGLHLMAFLGLVLGALTAGLGWVRVNADGQTPDDRHLVHPRSWREARGWFTVSGLCGGIGLWIGSTQQCVCIGVLGMGTAVGVMLFARKNAPLDVCRFEPELWRHWSRVGAAASLVFYLIEYFPAHLETHLEVNHPFMSLAWLGAGELMYFLLRLKVEGKAALRQWRLAVLGLMGVCVLPLAVVFGPKRWWVLNDLMLLRSTRIISEGRPWIDPPSFGLALHEFWTYTGALMLAVPLALYLLMTARRRQMPPWRAAGLTAMLTTAGIFLAWTLLQNRWMGFLETSLAMLALVAAPCVPLRWRGSLPVVLLALTVPGWAGFGWLQANTLADDPLLHAKAALGGMMATKEAAWNLRYYSEKYHTQTPARVMATPGPSPTLHYYGGVDTVGSFYWENIAGYHVVVDFFMDTGDAEARRIARERGLDFVMVTATPMFVLETQWLQLGRSDMNAAKRTLAFRLANPTGAQPPAWLEEVPLVDAPMARRDGTRIYRVVRERL